MSLVRPYKINSFAPLKAGELIGAIHMALVAKELKNYVNGIIKDTYIGHGLFVHIYLGVSNNGFDVFKSKEIE